MIDRFAQSNRLTRIGREWGVIVSDALAAGNKRDARVAWLALQMTAAAHENLANNLEGEGR